MRKVFASVAIITLLITVFLIYNHRQEPTRNDVINMTKDWLLTIEEIYLVQKIDGEWLTIFRDAQTISVARLVQNWLGYWEMKDELGNTNTLATSDYPPLQDQFSYSASTKAGISSYYFGQIVNPTIKRIEVETQKGSFENAIIISYEEGRFFFAKSDGEIVMPLNIRGLSETGELIYSTIKPN